LILLVFADRIAKYQRELSGMTKELKPASLETRIYSIRGQKVMLDSDLAELYQVETKVLNQAVSRNKERFPDDFMFVLTWEETKALRSQIVTLPTDSHFRYRPKAFTEHGILMLSSVLKSAQAVKVNIEIMRTFVKLRAIAAIHGEVNLRLSELERTVKTQGKSIDFILDLIDKELKKKKIGFKAE
jgi:hypothetical protein